MEANNWTVFDLEGDGLNPTKIYCLVYTDKSGELITLTDYNSIREYFKSYGTYIGHNIRRFDLPVLENLLDIKLPDRIIDTLALSWYLEPKRKKHSLDSYGEEFGIKKPPITDWFTQDINVYIHRCQEDVKINNGLWKKQLGILNNLYPNSSDLWRFLKYLDFKMYSAFLAEKSKWKLDIKKCQESIAKLEGIYNEKYEALAKAMPKVPVIAKRNPPAKPYKADGTLSSTGLKWKNLLQENNLPEDHNEPVDIITSYDDPNPGSHVQIKNWLYELGWKPQTIKYMRDKNTGEIKEIPQIQKDNGNGICESIEKLYEKEPSLELLDGTGVLKHRLGILNGFLRDVDDEGYLTAKISGLTNTLRFKHAEIVNLPKPEKPYGEEVRECLIAPSSDEELCGADMSGLEDRLKQHFIYPYDPDYVEELNREDYDPHLDIAVIAKMMTVDEAEAYKQGDHSKKSVRSIAKNGNYALI